MPRAYPPGPVPIPSAAEPDPHNLFDLDTERVVIGTVLIDGYESYDSISGVLTSDNFGIRAHQTVWSSIQRLASETYIGMDSVAHDLDERGQLNSIGGLPALMDLHTSGISGLRLSGFAETLRKKGRRRRQLALLALIQKSIELGEDLCPASVDELVALSERFIGHSSIRIEDLPPVGEFGEPVRYIIEPELPVGGLIALTGDSGSGKSTQATAWIREAIKRGRPCLILDRENPRVVAYDRMTRLGIHDGPALKWFGGWTREGAPEPDSANVRDWVNACDPKPLIVVDSFVAFLDGDENSATDVRLFMHKCRILADLGATVVVIHHDGKSDKAREFRGSSDFKAAVDQAFHVTNISGDLRLDRLRLHCFKSRYGFTGDVVYHYDDGRMLRAKSEAAPPTQAEQLTELLRANPGIGQKAFEDLAVKHDLTRSRTRDYLDNGISVGTIVKEIGKKNQFRHYLRERQDD
ncbi:MAG: AAA family ATPase [Acidobacteriota bacterium]